MHNCVSNVSDEEKEWSKKGPELNAGTKHTLKSIFIIFGVRVRVRVKG